MSVVRLLAGTTAYPENSYDLSNEIKVLVLSAGEEVDV